MKWATRSGCHIDRHACAWLIRRFIDSEAEFILVDDPEEVLPDAVPFDMRGATLSHHGNNCTFETILDHHGLADPALLSIARIVHEADIGDELFDSPEAPGLDVLVRALSMIQTDREMLEFSRPIFDGLYEYFSRANLLDRELD